MSLRFNERAHRYWLDGKHVQGVTTIIKKGLPSPALMYWSARTVAEFVADHDDRVEMLRGMGRGPMVAALKEVPWTERDTAAVKGTDVHALGELLVAGEKVAVPEHLAGYVEAYVDFLDTWKITPLVVEKPVANRPHWWAGKPDVVASLPDGRVGLFDLKTGSGIYDSTVFQLAAYAHAEFYAPDEATEVPFPKIDFAAAVHLRQDGYDVIPVKADDDVYREFRHIKVVAEAAKRAKDGYIGKPMTAPETDAA